MSACLKGNKEMQPPQVSQDEKEPLLVVEEFDELTYTVDAAWGAIGWSWPLGLIILVCGWSWIVFSCLEAMMVFYVPAVSCELGFSTTEQSNLLGIQFFGIALGNLIWGSVSDKYGRKYGLLPPMLAAAIGSFCLVFTRQYWMMLLANFTIGVGIGSWGLTNAYVAEFLPPKSRGVVLAIFYAFWPLGQTILPLFAWLVLPNHGPHKMAAMIFIMTISLPILFCWLPRSPRYLIATGKVPRASRILEFFSRVSGKALPEGKLVPTRDSDLGGEEDDAALGVFDQLKGLFSSSLWRMTVSVAGCKFILSMIYSVFIELPTYLATQGADRDICNGDKIMFGSSDYLRATFAAAGEIPGTFVATGLLASSVGRRRSIIASCVALALVPIPLLIKTFNSFGVVLFFGKLFVGATFCGIYVYVPEQFPTKLRGVAAGGSVIFEGLGGMAAPLIGVQLLSALGTTSVAIALIASTVIAIFFLLLAPKELGDKELVD